jgi:septal ring-binding cell division protein DamX
LPPPPAPRDRARGHANVEQPRTDEQAVSAEGREQPAIQPETQAVPQPVADAPDTTTAKTMHEDPTKLDQSGDPGAEKTGGEGSGGRGSRKGRS